MRYNPINGLERQHRSWDWNLSQGTAICNYAVWKEYSFVKQREEFKLQLRDSEVETCALGRIQLMLGKHIIHSKSVVDTHNYKVRFIKEEDIVELKI